MSITSEPTYDPFIAEATAGGGGDYEAPPSGTKPACIIGVFDLGHQPSSYQGVAEDKHQVAFLFELAAKQKNGKPFVLPQRYNFTLGEDSNLSKFIGTVVGKRPKPGELVNLKHLVSLPCLLTIEHKSGSDKRGNPRTYANITNVTGYPEGMPIPTHTVTPVVFSVRANQPFPDGLDWLPRLFGLTFRELCEGSREIRQRSLLKQNTDGDGDIPF